MGTVLWVIAVVLAVAFLAAGVMKLTQPKEKLAASGMGWAESYSAGTIKLIGALEVLAAIGLVLPAVLDIAPVLVPLAALGLVLIMIGAIITHARRREHPAIAVNVVLLILAAVVAWGRFGPHAFWPPPKTDGLRRRQKPAPKVGNISRQSRQLASRPAAGKPSAGIKAGSRHQGGSRPRKAASPCQSGKMVCHRHPGPQSWALSDERRNATRLWKTRGTPPLTLLPSARNQGSGGPPASGPHHRTSRPQHRRPAVTRRPKT